MKTKFKTNPLTEIPGMKGVWKYLPPGSPSWEPTHFLLIFRKDEAELFDLKGVLDADHLATADDRKNTPLLWFRACISRDRPRLEKIRVHFTDVVQASPRLAELIEALNFGECYDGGTWTENDQQRTVALEINAMIHREFFAVAQG
jgi:hypothetical protein